MERLRKFAQFGRFAMVGLLNTVIDLGVLNALMLLTGIASGIYFTVFKSISFLVAMTNSYIWNKRWTFKNLKPISLKEYLRFSLVSMVGMIINVTTASLVVNVITPLQGIEPKLWANIGALLAVGVTLIWNFFGYRNIVFKKR